MIRPPSSLASSARTAGRSSSGTASGGDARRARSALWMRPTPATAPDFVRHEFDVVEVATPDAAWKEIGAAGQRTAFVGAAAEEAGAHGVPPAGVNPKALVARLDWERSYKSDWEVDAISAATAKRSEERRV